MFIGLIGDDFNNIFKLFNIEFDEEYSVVDFVGGKVLKFVDNCVLLMVNNDFCLLDEVMVFDDDVCW